MIWRRSSCHFSHLLPLIISITQWGDNHHIKLNGHGIRIPKLGWVNMTEELRFEGKIMSATVSEHAGHWYVSMSVELEQPDPIDFSKESVGIDFGVKSLAVLSDGTVYENQGLLRSELHKLQRLNRELHRRQEGSNRGYRTKRKLARFHKKIKDRRADRLHKMTTEIARTYRLIGIEDLSVKGMLKNHKLALSIADVAWGEARRQLEYKSQWFGGRTIRVCRFFASSKRCSDCGYVHQELQLSDRYWACQGCGVLHDRDWNASKNIEAEALRLVGAYQSIRRGSGYVET
ncbi:MAG: RNA-guided endonuclease TnpB family protein [bacterium]